MVTLFGGCRAGGGRPSGERKEQQEGAAEVGPTEDLMREHGVLRRLLLIFDEAARRLSAGAPPVESIRTAAELNRKFVEDYHERMEEQFLFPRFRSAGRLVELVDVLKTQHDAGRRVTDTVLELTRGAVDSAEARRRLSGALRAYARMYRPHAAREDTVLFPALHQLVSAREFDQLGDQFEDRERELFGQDGFEKAVEQVVELERTLGIYELAKFTPAERQ